MSGPVNLVELEKDFIAGKQSIIDQGNALTFTIVGDGSYLVVSFVIQNNSYPIGRATSIKKGNARFLANLVIVGLRGAYTVRIEERSARVFDPENEQVWLWKGDRDSEEGIRGDVDVVFDPLVIATLARLLVEVIG